jgi:hypothetical protein
MKFYHYILLFLFIALIWRNYYLFFYKKKGPKPVKNIEGFESLSNCLEIGYPTEFCNRVPLESCVTNCPVGTFLPKKFNTY